MPTEMKVGPAAHGLRAGTARGRELQPVPSTRAAGVPCNMSRGSGHSYKGSSIPIRKLWYGVLPTLLRASLAETLLIIISKTAPWRCSVNQKV